VNSIPPEANTAFEEPVSLVELRHAIKQGKTNKAPGQDVICLEFFRPAWDVIKHERLAIMNHMNKDGRINKSRV